MRIPMLCLVLAACGTSLPKADSEAAVDRSEAEGGRADVDDDANFEPGAGGLAAREADGIPSMCARLIRFTRECAIDQPIGLQLDIDRTLHLFEGQWRDEAFDDESTRRLNEQCLEDLERDKVSMASVCPLTIRRYDNRESVDADGRATADGAVPALDEHGEPEFDREAVIATLPTLVDICRNKELLAKMVSSRVGLIDYSYLADYSEQGSGSHWVRLATGAKAQKLATTAFVRRPMNDCTRSRENGETWTGRVRVPPSPRTWPGVGP